MLNVTIGCDPEGFIRRKDGKFVSAAGYFPGTKKVPYELEGGAVQVDGVALEFNIIAADTQEKFLERIAVVTAQLDELVANTFDKDHSLSFIPVALFDEEDWSKIPTDAKVLGCDPDYNAMTGDINLNPTEKLKDLRLRTAAGHLHIGWTKDMDPQDVGHRADCQFIAKGFHQAYLKPFYPETNEERTRVKYYGHNGSYRFKPYGIELRAPSNVWLSTPVLQAQAFNATRNHFKKLTGL